MAAETPCEYSNLLDQDIADIGTQDVEIVVATGIECLPDETLTHILLFVPDECLKTCSEVCKKWLEIIEGQTLWRLKCLRTDRFIEDVMAPYYPDDWREFYEKSPYTKNLIKNCSGQDGLNSGWNILQNGGNQWKVETEHNGSDELPDEVLAFSRNQSYNFATSYGWCSMEQVIDLLDEGVKEELLDGPVQPDIRVSEWYAARFDCGNTYEMSVTLLTKPELSEENTLATFEFGPVVAEQWAPRTWNQVKHVFSDYGPGLRYIRFFHKGKDTQFWAGHYGCKMAGAQVQIVFKKNLQTNKVSLSSAVNAELEAGNDSNVKEQALEQGHGQEPEQGQELEQGQGQEQEQGEELEQGQKQGHEQGQGQEQGQELEQGHEQGHGLEQVELEQEQNKEDIVNICTQGDQIVDSSVIDVFPDETLTHILLFVSDDCLNDCSQVCKKWLCIIEGQTLWRQKCLHTKRFIDDVMAPFYPDDWRKFYYKAPYTRNLIKNCSGQDGLDNGWNILLNDGDQWKVETEHNGSDELPDEVLALSGNQSYNFATSYGWCSMEQVIDLLDEGVKEELLDGPVQPDIMVSEWYAARFDCGNIYEISVTLLTKPEFLEENSLAIFEFGPVVAEQWAPRTWNQVKHVFSDYGPGLRYIRFFHKGKDTQFWAGHYGCKMAGAQVQIQFKKDTPTNKVSPRSAINTEPEAGKNMEDQEEEEEDIYN